MTCIVCTVKVNAVGRRAGTLGFGIGRGSVALGLFITIMNHDTFLCTGEDIVNSDRIP